MVLDCHVSLYFLCFCVKVCTSGEMVISYHFISRPLSPNDVSCGIDLLCNIEFISSWVP
jgi:hypothetical protein